MIHSIDFWVRTEETLILEIFPNNIVLLGISQGCAVGLLTLPSMQCKLGAFVGLSGWMALRSQVESVVGKQPESVTGLAGSIYAKLGLEGAVPATIARSALQLQTPVFLSHARDDDDVIDFELGRQVRIVLGKLGMDVVWKEYGKGRHWIREPEGFNDIVEFLILKVGSVEQMVE